MKLKQILFLAGAAGLAVLLMVFIITSFLIGSDVKDQCQQAKKEYSGDCVEALITVLNDEGKSFKLRNSAIWALGQLGDSRALPVLQGYYTGNIPQKEQLDQSVSQYELKKAINLAGGGFNLTAFFWRY